MGKIQSAITGAIMTGLGIGASLSHSSKKSESIDNQQDPSTEDNDPKENSEEQGNLLTRQDEANDIAKHYVEAKKSQMEAFEARIAKLEAKSEKKGDE